MSPRAGLRPVRAAGSRDPADILDRFLDYVDELGLKLYPAQEQALLEVAAGRHVFLGTPTGSGKSLVALFAHYLALCLGETSYYTSPTKALASEKFFALCTQLGPESVGMLTGDASVNPDAPVVCCTAEILANKALRRGRATAARSVVMDEFHFYGDRERGVAWQIPLVCMPDAQFLLMSATMGDTREIADHLARRTGREVVDVSGSLRPVPLDYTWRETPLHATVGSLITDGKAPIYVVSFTHNECARTAQALTSLKVASGYERTRLAAALRSARFDTPYGRDLCRLLKAGIAVHHAGLLPRYRLMVEQLAQQGLLKVICGTDTLGVGVNIPIRTVLFAKLAKYDGRRVRVLAARDFHQIAGRAGRKGFDDQGSVVCQAPEHVIDSRRRSAAPRGRPRRRRTSPRNRVVWNRQTFERLVHRSPEKLSSAFRVTHGMIIHALSRGPSDSDNAAGYAAIVDLIERCHEPRQSRPQHLREAARLFRSLRRAGLVELQRDGATGRPVVLVSPGLQDDFSLHETLSLYLVDAVAALDHGARDYALDVVTLAEAILEDPRPILEAQERFARAQAIARMRADGLSYAERQALIETITYPRPLEDYLEVTFGAFASRHPWVTRADIGPKSIARELLQSGMAFNDYVQRYGLQRSEGLLLRYLNQVYKTLDQTVPLYDKTEALLDEIYALRAAVASVDASLAEEWSRLLAAGADRGRTLPSAGPATGGDEDRALAARVRAEMAAIVSALARGAYAEAVRCARSNPEDPWDEERFRGAMDPFLLRRGEAGARQAAQGRQVPTIRRGPGRLWLVRQVLDDGLERDDWAVLGRVDPALGLDHAGPLVEVYHIGR